MSDIEMDSDDDPAHRVKSLTVAEFVSHAKELYKADALDDFAKFVLTGIYDNVQHQVDPIKDAVQASDQISVLRDYDSVLGIHDNICVQAAITIYPVPKFEDTLVRNVHIKRSFTNSFGEHNDVPIHQIPNLCIAKWGTHDMIRVLLPGLYSPQRRNSFLNQTELATFYEKGLRPAVESLTAISAAEWPPTYSAEMFRARGKNGTLSFQTKTLSSWLAPSLGKRIRDTLVTNNVSWARGLVFLHQIRGVKASNGHSLDLLAAEEAWSDLVLEHDIAPDAGDWWVDVGLEITSNLKKCLAWRTDSHFHVVKDVLKISEKNAARITRPGSSKYLRDMTSHLTSVSGCRISPGARAKGPYHVKYLQMYATDKSITYRPDGKNFGKFLKGDDIIKGKADDYCRNLYELYREAIGKNYAHARIEIRVPLKFAGSALIDISVALFRDALVIFDPVVWWSLRAYRVLAFKHVLSRQMRGPSRIRSRDSALLLTAAAPWFLNGLHSAPDNGPSSRDLMGKILPLVDRVDADVQTLAYPIGTRARIQLEEDDEDDEVEIIYDSTKPEEDNLSVHSMLSGDDEPMPRQAPNRNSRPDKVPYNPYGIVFLREIRCTENIAVPRFSDMRIPMITTKTFRYIFGIEREDVQNEFFKVQLVVPPNPDRVPNKVRRTTRREARDDEPDKIFNLSMKGYHLPPPVQDNGSDEDDSDDNEDNDEQLDIDIDKMLTNLWRQFLVDVTKKVPNRSKALDSSYCVLNMLQREEVNDETYRNLRLREYFNDCQFRVASKNGWTDAFNKLWPSQGKKLVGKKIQNYDSMDYYISWNNLIRKDENIDDPEDPIPIEPMRDALRKRFNKLKWVPNAQNDRIWYTTRKPSFMRFPECDPDGPAPRILIKWGEKVIL
ncbi:hypothetical protein BDN70DRAFT_939291 [Pholiota conissans]|uniref:Uncharacterized protein n=1 Tax=Pholiota conissans TaxID=109636 RepID=A0A9P5YKI9_9AGAR|nr:hypothetical protein BDN70DRAFT_939291 [Pholiota conissans]